MSESLSQQAIGFLNSLGITQLSRSDHYNVTHYGEMHNTENLEEISRLIHENPTDFKKLVSILRNIRDCGEYTEFFALLESNDLPLDIFIPLCMKFITKEDILAQISSVLYGILLGYRPIQHNYNEILIQKVIHNIIKASNSVELKKDITDVDISYVSIADGFFSEFSSAISADFINIATREVYTAFIELSFKIGSTMTKQISQYVPNLEENVMKFIQSALQISPDYVAPHVVSFLVADNLPKNQRVQKFREKIIESTMYSLQGSDSTLTLICQHLTVRCPDRAAMREMISQTIKSFFNAIHDKQKYTSYLMKCIKSTKMSLRNVSLEVLSVLIPYFDLNFINEITEILKKMTTEVHPNIKSLAIGALSSIVEYTGNTDFFDVLKHSLLDEKVVVRKSSLNFLSILIKKINEENSEILELLSQRTRDKSPLIRHEAIKMLSDYFTKFISEKTFFVFLDSVLPRVLDDDKKIVTFSTQMIETHFLSDINLSMKYSSVFDENIVENLRSSLQIIKTNSQKQIKNFAKLISKKLNGDVDGGFWALADVISEFETKQFNKDLLKDLWPKRLSISHHFLSICSKHANKTWIKDAMNDVTNISKGNLTCNYGHIKYLVEISGSDKENTKIFRNLFKKCLEKNIKDNDCIVYLVGCLSSYFTLENRDEINPLIDICFDKQIDNKIRSIGILSLGKCLLTKKEVAQDVIILLSNDLTSDSHSTIKMNEITALSDLLIKYGTFASVFIDNALKLLIDGEDIVKRHVLVMITRLVTEDYIKVKSNLFFKLLKSLLDENPMISNFASSCIFDLIVPKSSKILLFLSDAVSFYNSPDVGIFGVNIQERKKIYDFCVDRMTDIQCWSTIQTLCSKYIDHHMTVDTSHMRDSLTIIGICYQAIISRSSTSKSDNLNETESQELSSSQESRNDGRESIQKLLVIIQQQIIKVLLPKMIDLHYHLRSTNSPLQGDLKKLMSLIVRSDSSFLQYIEMIDKTLSNELKIYLQRTPENEDPSLPPSPSVRRVFSSSLLTRLAARGSPARQTTNSTPSRSQTPDDFSILLKRMPNLDEDE
ncbi:hypothetical protein TVAG_056570 [Trichomonas vaginalis G3]|uniref:Condensin complex subunit 1 C-terminal domain-containing protein n=1 Tax=Trichomonas vaginalis (strain ATCC PRA-98 / G3) TaxID=412133 RepID=A2ECL6_TRIV3|nr:meiotic chromosome condensation [Trichomonas vaginalis G3]EAY09613.1 hypothetical protein TVAG_056570 [Trichomonas vaginalis G3]KAI5502124.1 meiotic chromosome condensation [Trichomonas vaginalis G3]|eukprot:XP_001321836.1 hypothetical protein [Trichomonas vaginalis G3]